MHRLARWTNSHRSWRLLLALSLLAALSSAAGATEAGELFPDGVCYPVNGTGYILPRAHAADTVRVGALSPLVEGDVLVVETGTITFLDFRDGQSSVFGENTKFIVPAVIDRNRPTAWEALKERLARLFRDAERSRLEEGASRSGECGVWPDGGVEFAPEVPIALEWWGVADKPSAIQLRCGGKRSTLALPEAVVPAGSLPWGLADRASGPVEWCLLDANGEPYLCGRFALLTAQEADRRRAAYLSQAEGDPMPRELAAVLRALADRTYLW